MVKIRSVPLVYRIDAKDRISYVCPRWEEEAQAWPTARLAPGQILGRRLWDCLVDASVCEIYSGLVSRVRGGKSVEFMYRCDTPDWRRLYRLQISLVGACEVQFVSLLEDEEERPTVRLLKLDRPQNEARPLSMCSWCHRVALPIDYWVPLEDAAQIGGFMEADPLPRLKPGACPQCQRFMRQRLQD